MKRLSLAIFPLILFTTCIDPITFDVPNNQDFLIVDGFITDENGPHQIRLSRSAIYANVLDGGVEERVSGATLMIIDNNGISSLLREVSPGRYETDETFFGVVGNEYFLQIDIDGQSYQSTKETLYAASEIESVNYAYLSKPFVNEFGNTEENYGIEFYANFETTSEKTYYKWDWESDYMLIQILFSPEDDPSMPDTCYVHETPSGFINILKNESTQSRFVDYPVSFVPVDFKFNSKYSMNLIQYAMSDEAASFWNQVSSQVNIEGSIFDPTPAKIVGNIKNINNQGEEVLGYFGAFGKSEKRVFLDSVDVTVLLDLDVIFNDDLDICATTGPSPVPPPNYCFSCALFPGSSIQKPVFWE